MADPKTNGSSSRAAAASACPTCGKPTVHQFRPFCSKRCADVDLHRWFSGRYAIPVKQDEDADGAPPETPAPALGDDSDKR
ncbi:MAG: DNA gyrase inhibitor YacG [Xanthobacteraceae bacterium]